MLQYNHAMKTIAITIDDKTLEQVKKMEKREDRNRSEIIREALRMYVMERERQLEQERERKIFRRNRNKLKRQAAALIHEQTKP